MMFRMRVLAFAISGMVACASLARSSDAAEATTGLVIGSVLDTAGRPIVAARVTAAAPSGRSSVVTDGEGHFTILGLPADTYALSAQAVGYESESQDGITVIPGQAQRATFRLQQALKTIGRATARDTAFTLGSTSDTFTVSGAAARAIAPPVSSSGLASYTAGTVQGAIAAVPGVDLDSFANAILRGGKVDDAVFDFDSVPLPQGLIAEPGGNVAGAQLPTTGIASTSVTLAGYLSQGDNSLGGVVDQVPAIGTYPGRTNLEVADGIGAKYQYANLQVLEASPDLRWRYALAAVTAGEYFQYGDSQTFYPAEAATYGVALQSRGQYSITSNVHYRLSAHDDLSLVGLVGEANYDQYGSPFSGETVGFLDGNSTVFPGETNPNAPVGYPARIRGSYDVIKAQYTHTGEHSLSRIQLYESQFGSTAGGPFWDENGFPDGAISLFAQQGGREQGLVYDGDEVPSDELHLHFGAEGRVNNSFLNQVVPTADEFITSSPTITSYLAYLSATYSPAKRLDLTATGRLSGAHIRPGFGSPYTTGALDPHFGAAYRLGDNFALRATFDHNTVAPKPLEADRVDSTNTDPTTGAPAPFVPLAPETSNDFTYSFESTGRVQFRATYFEKFENNRIDVLPYNFRAAISSGLNPSGVGVPTNAGELRARGAELYLKTGGLTFNANLIRGFSSSASQFAYNDLNAPAVAANHLFPISYVPDFSSTLSYEITTPNRHVRLTPSVSFHTGFPYGNGRMVYTFDANNKPIQVANDNYVNPGAAYYFLRDPSMPFNAVSNPYIGNLGTPEGNDPNTLRGPSQIIANLHMEGDLGKRLTAIVDVVNLFGNFSPNAYQNNPYQIGPPGYKGGNPLYESYYYGVAGYTAAPGTPALYTLGNGVPTNDGQTQIVPWQYGRGAYVPQGYPQGRTIQVRLRYRL